MNFEDFQLPPFLIRDLYKNALVEEHLNNEINEDSKSVQDYILGDNQRNVMIIINDTTNSMIAEQELNFLNGILAACRLTVRDVAILNIAHIPGTGFEKIFSQYSPAVVLMFGVTPDRINLPVNFPGYRIIEHQKVRFMAAPPLAEIENDKEQKKSLWAGLQQIFLK